MARHSGAATSVTIVVAVALALLVAQARTVAAQDADLAQHEDIQRINSVISQTESMMKLSKDMNDTAVEISKLKDHILSELNGARMDVMKHAEELRAAETRFLERLQALEGKLNMQVAAGQDLSNQTHGWWHTPFVVLTALFLAILCFGRHKWKQATSFRPIL